MREKPPSGVSRPHRRKLDLSARLAQAYVRRPLAGRLSERIVPYCFPASGTRAGHLWLPVLLAGLMVAALAFPVQGQQQASPDEGPSQISETYRDWQVRCVAATAETGAARQCEMSQQLNLSDTGQRLLAVAMIRQPDGRAMINVVTPFGLILGAGLQIEVNGTVLQELGFLTCLPEGCIARAVIEDAVLSAFRSATTGEIRMTALSGETIAPQISLMGFSAAWNRLGALAP